VRIRNIIMWRHIVYKAVFMYMQTRGVFITELCRLNNNKHCVHIICKYFDLSSLPYIYGHGFISSIHCTFFFPNGSTALVGPGRYFGFLIYLRAVGLLGRVISSSQGLYLNTQHKHRKTHIHTIPKVGFEPAITASERSKTVHTSNRSATATGLHCT
jgi:hypothetical protein